MAAILDPAALPTPDTESRPDLLLLGIDLEDVRSFVPGGDRYAERVPAMAERYLALFAQHDMHTTFFVVGDVARRYPGLVREIRQAGHEIACHTDAHCSLEEMTPEALRRDLGMCLDALSKTGADAVRGFRAPTLSLTERTRWVYEVLASVGFTYSSSVLPGENPLFGWAGFGTRPRRMGEVWELPVSVLPVPKLRLPFMSGVYLRLLPAFVLDMATRHFRRHREPVVGYLHPYDIDGEQERFRHPYTEDSLLRHALMFYNRGSVLRKVTRLIEAGMHVQRYDHYVATLRDSSSSPGTRGS